MCVLFAYHSTIDYLRILVNYDCLEIFCNKIMDIKIEFLWEILKCKYYFCDKCSIISAVLICCQSNFYPLVVHTSKQRSQALPSNRIISAKCISPHFRFSLYIIFTFVALGCYIDFLYEVQESEWVLKF